MKQQYAVLIVFAVLAAAGLAVFVWIGMDLTNPTGNYIYWHTFRRADGGQYRHYAKELHTVEKSQPLPYGYMNIGGKYFSYARKDPFRSAYKERLVDPIDYSVRQQSVRFRYGYPARTSGLPP